MSRRREPRGTPRLVDVSDAAPLAAALESLLPRIATLTLNMCWHGGVGHDYPLAVMQAARRLRQRDPSGGGPDAAYTSLDISPSSADLKDFMRVLPYCDLAYATDASGEVLAEFEGDEGKSLFMRGSDGGG